MRSSVTSVDAAQAFEERDPSYRTYRGRTDPTLPVFVIERTESP